MVSESNDKPPVDMATARKDDGHSAPPTSKWIGLGVGAGIGSAAVAAALLYTSRTKRKPRR